MKSADEILGELLDREEIRELPLRYCDCVWRNDVAGIVDLFAEDGSFTVKTPNGETSHKGRDALVETYTQGLNDLQPRPYIHNHVIELGYHGQASGRCYLDLRSEKRNMEWIGAGHYDDEYVKVGDRWKFASRYFTAIQFDPATVGRTARAAAKKAAPERKPSAKKAVPRASGKPVPRRTAAARKKSVAGRVKPKRR